jgi:hypothetical protein
MMDAQLSCEDGVAAILAKHALRQSHESAPAGARVRRRVRKKTKTKAGRDDAAARPATAHPRALGSSSPAELSPPLTEPTAPRSALPSSGARISSERMSRARSVSPVELDFGVAAAAPLQDFASLLARGDSDFGGDGYDDDDDDDVLFEDARSSEEAVLPPRLESGGGTKGAAAPEGPPVQTADGAPRIRRRLSKIPGSGSAMRTSTHVRCPLPASVGPVMGG